VRISFVTVAVLAGLLFPAAAAATPVATSDAEYTVLGRVFPDPLGACSAASAVCSPNAQGNVPAIQFIQHQELIDGLKFLNSRPDWRRFLEVLVLDGKLGEGSGTQAGNTMFPGNNLGTLEFTPKPEFISAGLPTSTLERKKSDLVVARVTDESVPDKGKKRYVLSLSIHGIERAGAEGGTRALEDLVTALTSGRWSSPILPMVSRFASGPSFGDVLRKTVIYFTYPNPDGWRRGSVTEGGVFFQRYNGNGVDLNRDWPDIGFSFRPYSGLSEPESRALGGFLRDVTAKTKSSFAAGDDLHGQPFADALSFTLLPHGRHDFGKDHRIKETAKTINVASYEALKWSPMIQPNSAPRGGGAPCISHQLGTTCAKIYAQTWGTVYDTINYTTTGTLGDWFDSTAGLGADGIDNEMSFSHLDKNIVFDPHTEQLHVDGNKFLIYAHVAEMLNPATASFNVAGTKGYVPNTRVTRARTVNQADPSKKSTPQEDIQGAVGVADPAHDGQTIFPFTVYRTDGKKGPRIYNGGMRVDITTTNAAGVGTGAVTLQLQCRHCDHHVGTEHEDGWVTVAEDYNQSLIYAQAGITAAVNNPEASPEGVAWRAVVSQGTAITRMDVDFTTGPASTDGNTEGDPAPVLEAYNVANTDFFTDLNGFVPNAGERFQAVDPRAVIAGTQSLAGLETLVLADEAFPGYTDLYAGESARPSGLPTADFEMASERPTSPGLGVHSEASAERRAFTIGPNDGNASMTVRISWPSGLNDFDLYLYRVENGMEVFVDDSGGGVPGSSEQIEVKEPPAGDYIVEVLNFAATDPQWSGSVSFTPFEAVAASAVTAAEKDAWMAKLREWVSAGGNLVLTDGALRALGELTSIPGSAVGKQTVYVGQATFSTGTGDTLSDPLNKGVAEQGARFNTGMRRQTFEPTPLGYAIQNAAGDDASFARQYDIDRTAFEAAGGRVAATSANSGAGNAAPVHSRVTYGEIPVGQGTVRALGALLPQPTQEYDHQLGIEPYAVTYTGYILMRNLLEQ
jgi:hypothetical protein